jgi:guanosine-3',5'-bis(diphosphate) 3'-pyrophosphohydrolase
VGELNTLLKAVVFAADKHRDGRRKGEEASPYINHPVQVAALIAGFGETDIDTLVAAFLHDTIEDTKTTAEEIEMAFGPKVRALVVEVTEEKREITDPIEKKKDKQLRRERQIAGAPDLSHGAKLIRLADKQDNVRDILERPPKDWSEEERQQYFDFAKRMNDACRDASPDLAAQFDNLLDSAQRSVHRA